MRNFCDTTKLTFVLPSLLAELRHQQLMKGHEELTHQQKRWEEEKAILEERLEQAKKQAKKNKRGRKGGDDEMLNEKL